MKPEAFSSRKESSRLLHTQQISIHRFLWQRNFIKSFRFRFLSENWYSTMVQNQMKLVGALLFALCLFAPLLSAKSTDFHYCNKKTNYAVNVTGLEINPYPISRGKDTSFKIAATTGSAISGGKLVIDVSYFGFHIHSEDHELCEETSCPVSVGDFVVSHSQELPGITPPGSYTLKMTMKDEKKKELTCITFDFSIGFFAEESLAVAVM